MGDHVGDPFDDIDSEEEDLEKPPTPEIHHGGDSPDAPGFSDISDNEQEETTKEEGPTKHSDDSNDSASGNSPSAAVKSGKEHDTIIKDKHMQGSPIYDQEISPVSSTDDFAEEVENTSKKVEDDVAMDEKETASVAAKICEETASESTESKQESVECNDESSRLEQSVAAREKTEDIHEGQTAEDSADPGITKGRSRRISSGAGTDDDLDMPISPLGLGLSGTESDIVDDILKSDVSSLLPDIKEDSKEEAIGISKYQDNITIII